MSTTPAGWYPDTTEPGMQRWWDGTQWSPHRAPLTAASSPGADTGATTTPHASFGARLGALVLDGLIVVLPVFVVITVGAVATIGLVAGGASTTGSGPATASLTGLGVLFGFVIVGLALLVGMVAPLLYFAGLEGGRLGQTIGKWAMGIRVVDASTGGDLPPSRAWVRILVRQFVSGPTLYLGYLWMLWDEQDRTWHDMAADSHVVVVVGPKASFRELRKSFRFRA